MKAKNETPDHTVLRCPICMGGFMHLGAAHNRQGRVEIEFSCEDCDPEDFKPQMLLVVDEDNGNTTLRWRVPQRQEKSVVQKDL